MQTTSHFYIHKNIFYLVLRIIEAVKPVLENTDYTVQKTGDNEITIQTVILQVITKPFTQIIQLFSWL